MTEPRRPTGPHEEAVVDSVLHAVLDPGTRQRLGMAEDDRSPLPVVVELNVRYEGGREGAARCFHQL
jgi:hypothetical protein